MAPVLRSADLAAAADDIFIGVELLQAHGTPGVQLLGGNAHLAAQAEFSPVGEAGGDIDIDRRGVHQAREALCRGRIPGEDGVTVARGVLTVHITSAPLRNELMLMRSSIIERINAALGREVIREIVFR